MRSKGGRAGLPARVSGRHAVPENRQAPPILEVRPGNKQGWWKRSTFRWDGRQLTLDKTVGSRVWRHTQGCSGRPASDLGWGSSSKTAPGSLSTVSPAGRTPPHGDGSMYSQANVTAGKWLRLPYPSVAVRDRGHWNGVAGSGWAHEASNAWWVERCSPPGAPRKSDGDEPVRSPKNTSVNFHSIIRSGLIPGGEIRARDRQTVFFLPVDPMDKGHKDPDVIDLSVPRRA